MAACHRKKLKLVSFLVFGWRAAGKLTKDTMKLGIAAKPCFEGSFKKSGGVTSLALRFILIEEALHALPIAEVNDREACLLLEESAEARGTETYVVSEVVEIVG